MSKLDQNIRRENYNAVEIHLGLKDSNTCTKCLRRFANTQERDAYQQSAHSGTGPYCRNWRDCKHTFSDGTPQAYQDIKG